MIFVTVGTHEQPFNRLIEYLDSWAKEHDEKVVMQTGFSTYEPKCCDWKKLYSYDQMVELVDQARIVITHGGPSSFIMPLQKGKIPIVVPRRKDFDEHVNDHQVDFCDQVAGRLENIIVIHDIERLGETIANYDEISRQMKHEQESNNTSFCAEFDRIVSGLLELKKK